MGVNSKANEAFEREYVDVELLFLYHWEEACSNKTCIACATKNRTVLCYYLVQIPIHQCKTSADIEPLPSWDHWIFHSSWWLNDSNKLQSVYFNSTDLLPYHTANFLTGRCIATTGAHSACPELQGHIPTRLVPQARSAVDAMSKGWWNRSLNWSVLS